LKSSTSMATITNFCAALSVAIIFAISNAPSSTSEPTISASPSVLPYVTAPNMSSFFPSPSAQGPPNSATPPNSETLAPVPSSGEFVGKSSSDSTRLDSGTFISGFGLVSMFVTRLIFVV
ncbi:hypothetical protein F2P56_000093, partial [Juglans regia]